MQDTNPTPQPTVAQTVTPTETVATKKKSNKKIIIILLVVFLFLPLLCCGLFFLIFSVSMRVVEEKKNEVMNAVVVDVCNTHGDFTFTEYEQWFDSAVGYENAVASVETTFPEDYDCNELVDRSLFDTLLEGGSASYNFENEDEFLEMTVNGNDMTFEKTSPNWVITEIE